MVKLFFRIFPWLSCGAGRVMKNPIAGNLESMLKRIPISRLQKWPLSIQISFRANVSSFVSSCFPPLPVVCFPGSSSLIPLRRSNRQIKKPDILNIRHCDDNQKSLSIESDSLQQTFDHVFQHIFRLETNALLHSISVFKCD